MEGLVSCFEELSDPRNGNAGLHDLGGVMVIALWHGVMRRAICVGYGIVAEFIRLARDEMQRERTLVVTIEIRPIHRHDDLAPHSDDLGNP